MNTPPNWPAAASGTAPSMDDSATSNCQSPAILFVDRDFNIFSWNDGAVQLFGWKASEMVGLPYLNRFPAGAPRDAVRQRMTALYPAGEVHEERLDYRKDGSRVWVEAHIFPRARTPEPYNGFIGVFHDITQRRLAEETTRRDLQIFAQLHDCVLCTDFAGNITYWNDAATRLHGWTAAEMQGHCVFDMFPPETRAAVQREIVSFGDRKDLTGVFHVSNKDGSRVWVQIRITPFRDENNRRAGFVVVAHDITERRQADEALRRSEAMMAEAQRIAHFGSWELDLANPEVNANPLRWSDESYRIFGYEPGSVQVSNELFFSRIPPEDRAAIERAVVDAIATRGEYSIDHRILLPDGSVRHVHEQARVFVDESSGQPVRMVGTVHDVTERKQVMAELVRAKEEAEAAAHAKSQFLAVLSHEIRTPLNPIIGAAQLLLDLECSPEQRELLEIINNAGEHLHTLLNDMLDLARMEAGPAELTVAVCSLHQLVQGIFDIKRNDARQKGLALVADLDDKIAVAYLADPPRLRQILLNLVGNAVKFTPHGEVSIRLERLASVGPRDHLRFFVRDTGIGLHPDHLQRIFEPFYQVDSSSTRRYEGAGLGLSICRRLVELMDGELGVESEYGHGSTFWFTVWLERAMESGAGGPGRSPAALAASGPRILLVEDDERNRYVLAHMLQRAGCQVAVATTATAALDLFTPDAFDLIFMDLRLPDLDGFETARRLRARELAAGAAPTPIVAQTANTAARDVEAARLAGMDGFLAKPIHWQELIDTLNRHLPSSGAGSG